MSMSSDAYYEAVETLKERLIALTDEAVAAAENSPREPRFFMNGVVKGYTEAFKLVEELFA